MVAKNLEQAISRFTSATSHMRDGLTMQRQRIQDAYDAAPRVFEVEPFAWIEVSGLSVNDVDYYAYELVRLWKTAEAMQRPFRFPPELADAPQEFAKAFPRLLAYRNATTHFATTSALDNVVVLSSALEADDDGVSLRTMVSPLSEQVPMTRPRGRAARQPKKRRDTKASLMGAVIPRLGTSSC